MPKGGARQGSGRPLGAIAKVTAKPARKRPRPGELPHEWLLRVMRNEEIDGEKPVLAQRIDAAKAAAPYFAPRLAQSQVDLGPTNAEMQAEVRAFNEAEGKYRFVGGYPIPVEPKKGR